MKKWLLSSLVGLFLVSVVSVSHAAVSADVLVPIDGDSKFAILYFPLGKNGMTLDLGAGYRHSTANSPNNQFSLVLGVGNWPVLGGIDTDFNLGHGTSHTAAFGFDSFVVSKTWLYRITDQFNIGFTLNLLEYGLRGDSSVRGVFTSFYPVFGAKLDLF